MYSFNEKIVLRDIAGICFLVDISEKKYYKDKILPSFNNTGKELIKIMYNLKKFDEEEVFKEFIKLINDINFELEKIIKKDIEEFIDKLVKSRYIERI